MGESRIMTCDVCGSKVEFCSSPPKEWKREGIHISGKNFCSVYTEGCFCGLFCLRAFVGSIFPQLEKQIETKLTERIENGL